MRAWERRDRERGDLRGARPHGLRRPDLLLPRTGDRFRRGGAGSALVCRPRGPTGGGRHCGLRPAQGRRANRGLQGLHEGPVRPPRSTDRRLPAREFARRRRGIHRRARGAGGGQGRRSRRRQGGRARPDGGRSPRCGPRGAGRRLRRCRHGTRHRGDDGGRGGQLLRPGRRRDGAAAGDGTGPQGLERGRYRTQHRRHGRLLASARDDACALRGGADTDRRAPRARPGGRGHAL